jgi:hypothetical protein
MKKLLVIALLSTISACGGGGGGGSAGSAVTSPQPTLQIDSTNAAQVASTSKSSDTVTSSVGGLSIYTVGQPTNNAITLTDFTRQVFQLDQRQNLQPQVTPVYCQTGSVSPIPNSTSGEITFTDCNTGQEVLNGKISFSYSGNSTNFTVSVTYTNFSFVGGGKTATVNATLTISYSSTSTGTIIKSNVSTFNLEINSDYVRLYNFSLTESSSSSGTIIATDFDYTFESSFINGIVRVTTDPSEGGQTLMQNASDPFPYSGSFVVIGANSRVKVTANNDGLASGSITIDVDTNGDGVYDQTSTQTWGDFSVLSSL